MDKKIFAATIAAVTVATGAHAANGQLSDSGPEVAAKQAQAANLLKSIGDLPVMRTQPECTDVGK